MTATDTETAASSFTDTATATPTGTVTATATESPTRSASPTQSLTFTLSPSRTPSAPFNGTVKVYNEAGELVATLSEDLAMYQAPTGLSTVIPSFLPDQGGAGVLNILGPSLPLVWSGQSNSGQIVDSGLYYVTLEVLDSFGKSETWTAPLTVLRSDSSTVVEVYNSAGELVWHRSLSPLAPGRVTLSDSSLIPGASGAGLKISFGSGPSDFVVWDGNGSLGQALTSGTYMVKVDQQSGSGGKSTFSYAVTLLQPSPGVFDWLAAAPNPVRSGTSSVMVSLQGAAPGVIAWGEAYSLAGEHVGTLSYVSAGNLRWDLPGGLASGVYILHVSARDSQGRLKTAPVKVAVLK
jgi:hypothetical protein